MPPPTWTGRYLDGRNAVTHPVTVEAGSTALVINPNDGASIRWPYDQIRQTQGVYDGQQLRLEYGTDPVTALVIWDQRFLTALRARAPHLVSVIHDPTQRGLRLKLTIVAALVTVLVTGAIYRWGIPGLARLVTPYVPLAWEQQLGRQVVEHLAPAKERCTDPYRTQIIHSMLARLAATVPNNPYGTIQFHIVDEPVVNAFAAPGGYVVVFRGLLEKTASPEQLAGVLAHELQHIYKRHTTRAILEHTSTTVLIAAVSGDFTGAATLALDNARTLGALRYSRGHEEEADAEGMKMMIEAGVNPAGMIEFFEIMTREHQSDDGLLRYFSTHPAHDDRIRTLTALAGGVMNQGRPLLPGLDWKSIRSVCRFNTRHQAYSKAAASEPLPSSSPLP